MRSLLVSSRPASRLLTVTAALGLLGATLLAGCGESEEPTPGGETEVTLEGSAGKSDRVGNRSVDRFAGPLAFNTPVKAELPARNYRVGYTFRARAGQEIKLTAFGETGRRRQLDTTLTLYGPRTTRGTFPFLRYNDDQQRGERGSTIKLTPPADGIYLVAVAAFSAGTVNVNLACGGVDCDWLCPVIRLYNPQCGIDGHTYSNGPAAACFAVPIAHPGQCGGQKGDACDDATPCGGSLYCARAPESCGAQGTCTDRPELCYEIYSPVCGCDGTTYSNDCFAASNGQSVASRGECQASCTGQTEYTPGAGELEGGTFVNDSGDATTTPPTFARTYRFDTASQSVAIDDAVAPCPPGAFCFWSGIVTLKASWSVNAAGHLELVYDAQAESNTRSWGMDYFKELTVEKTCSGQLVVVEVRGDGSNVRREFLGPAVGCEGLNTTACAASAQCEVRAEGCEGACQPDGEGGRICHPCDPIPVCRPRA